MENNICTFGEILIDFTDSGTTPSGTKLFAQHPGGAPANVAVGVKRLGGNASFIGKIGDDMHGTLLKGVLDEEGVDVSNLVQDDTVFTTLAFVSVGPEGERQFSFARKPGADTQMTFEEMDQDMIKNSKIFHVGSLSLTHEPSRTAEYKAIDLAKDNGVIISYDPNYRESLWLNEPVAIQAMRSLINKADIMKISDEETALLTDIKDPEGAAKSLIDQGVKVVAVTLGDKGALIANKEGAIVVPGFKSQVADTNGAGDSFWSAMLVQVANANKALEELSLDELADFTRFANGVAALTVRKSGAIPAMPTLAQATEFLASEK